MDLKHLEFFLTICKEKSFSKAARKLYISQQGLSKAILRLEQELQVPLFIRNNMGIELTPYGLELEKHITPYLHYHDYIASSVQSVKGQMNKSLMIGFAAGTFDFLPKNFLSNFIAAHTDSYINVQSFSPNDCMQSILEHKINLGFCPSPINFDHFNSLYSIREKVCLLVGKDHPFIKKTKVFMSDLKNERVIGLNNCAVSQDILSLYGFQPQILLNSLEINLIETLCSNNIAVSFYAGRTDLLSENIKMVEIADLNVDFEVHFIANKHSYLTDLAQKFITYTGEQFAYQGHSAS